MKVVVAAAAALGVASCFLSWLEVKGGAPALVEGLPRQGMELGGPVLLACLAVPLIVALVAIAGRFGRGLALLGVVGSMAASAAGNLKLQGLRAAVDELAEVGVTAEVGAGFYLYLGACSAMIVGCLVAAIRPEVRGALAASAVAPSPPRGPEGLPQDAL